MARRPVYGGAEWERICEERRNARHAAILTHAADGCTDAEIAAALCYAPDTVKEFWRHIRWELGARNRTHAVALAYQRGILS
jgi:DNA-binding NarL/FixJ family response regulator